jgi:hypothetical protein
VCYQNDFSPGRAAENYQREFFRPVRGLIGRDVNTHGFTVAYYLPRLRRWEWTGARARAAASRNAGSDKTSAMSPGADHLTPSAFLDRPIFRIQFAPPVRVSKLIQFVNSVGNYFSPRPKGTTGN